MLISIISGFVFLAFFAYLPGKLISKLTKLPDWFDLQLTLGLVILALILFFGRFFLPFTWLLGLYLLITLFLTKKYSLKFKLPSIDKRILLVILIGVTAQSLPYLKTLNLQVITVAIASNHDQAWHLSLIHELTKHFPPQIPGFSGQTLKNYHYFYDLLIASNVSVFKAKAEVLLQLVYPILFSTLFGFSIFRVLAQLTKRKSFQLLGLFLAFFANNLSFTTSNFFLVDQPLMFIFNHQTVFSIAITLYFLIILKLKLKKPSLKKGILLGLILASLSNLKTYAFIVLSLSLAILAIKYIKKLTYVFISTALTTGLIILLTFKPTEPILILKPFWLLTAFTDKIIVPLLPQLYARSSRFYYPPLVFILILFLNYHLKLLALFIKKRSLLINLLSLVALSSLVSLFFLFQTNSPYNIIQFAPYATVILGLLLVALADQLKPRPGLSLLLITLILGLPTSFKTLATFAKSKPDLPPLQQELVSVIKPLAALPHGITLSLVDRDYHLIPDPRRPLNFIGNNLIGSIGEKRTYFADQKQLEVLNIDYQSRLNKLNHLKQNFCQDKSLLKQQSIKYLVLADDLIHCTGNDQIKFTQLKKTDHFALFKLDY